MTAMRKCVGGNDEVSRRPRRHRKERSDATQEPLHVTPWVASLRSQ